MTCGVLHKNKYHNSKEIKNPSLFLLQGQDAR